ncbi:MAG TPA: hypothetical protein VGC40_07785 [Paenirhodobacter sp.]
MPVNAEDLTIVFPVRPGASSLMARILVCSIRKFMPAGVRITAVAPRHATPPQPDTLDLFEELRVERRAIETPLFFRHNVQGLLKVDAASAGYDTPQVLLLNPNCMILAPCDLRDLRLAANGFSARPTFRKTLFEGEDAEALNALAAERFGLDTSAPQGGMGFQTFNSGVVLFARDSCVPGQWGRVVTEFLGSKAGGDAVMADVDQLGLGVMAARAGGDFTQLAAKYNMLPWERRSATLVQYFGLAELIRTARTRDVLLTLAAVADDRGLNLLGEIEPRDIRQLAQG